MKKLSVVLALVAMTLTVKSQDILSMYKESVFSKNGKSLPYRIMYPKNFNPKQKYPLLIFLHGSGERGSDNKAQLTHGASLFASDSVRDKFPAIVIFPQCPAEDYWARVKTNQDEKGFRSFVFEPEGKPTEAMELLVELVKSFSHEKFVDRKMIYVGGLSMGGMGTFEILSRLPKTFAAAFTICGGSNPNSAKKYAKYVKVWIFHGEMDDVVSPEYSKSMAKAIQSYGGTAKLTLYPYANHNSWDSAFAEPELLPWLFSIKK